MSATSKAALNVENKRSPQTIKHRSRQLAADAWRIVSHAVAELLMEVGIVPQIKEGSTHAAITELLLTVSRNTDILHSIRAFFPFPASIGTFQIA